ncbi:hypothetical protein [Streptomyces sp. NPDC093990]|uniref:DUF6959 family protein n=1 Tax=Streptomyces sp. NPDC093990 TaxID=3155306 RepID=UPI00342C6058
MVRPPGRHFPGVLVQGDPLHVLRGEVGEILAACGRDDLAGAGDTAGLLLSGLDELLAGYEAALTATGSGDRTEGRRPAGRHRGGRFPLRRPPSGPGRRARLG